MLNLCRVKKVRTGDRNYDFAYDTSKIIPAEGATTRETSSFKLGTKHFLNITVSLITLRSHLQLRKEKVHGDYTTTKIWQVAGNYT